MIRRGPHRHAFGCAVLLAIACSEQSTPIARPATVTPSAPTPFVAAPAANIVSAEVDVYVSLPPDSIPDGVTATIHDQRTGTTLATPVTNGGFDPVALPASVGDTIAVTVQTTASPLSFTVVVPPPKPPVVIRTDPVPNKRDVPLNASLVLVFSQPIDGATLTGSAIQLTDAETPVAGQLSFTDAQHTAVTFTPAQPLATNTDYQFSASTGVRDTHGLALPGPVTLTFTTGGNTQTAGLVFSSITAGGPCGLTTSGAAYCWGDNRYGQLGTGVPGTSLTPLPVAGGLTFTEISADGGHTCAITTLGAAYCWGLNGNGELGIGSIGSSTGIGSSTPTLVSGGLTFRSISAGDWYTCGVTTSGAAYCWGTGYYGQLGVDSAAGVAGCTPFGSVVLQCTVPVPVSGGLTFATVEAGSATTCGITTTAALYCWGDNSVGELGIGTTAGPQSCVYDYLGPGSENPESYPCSAVPVAAAGGRAWRQVQPLGSSVCGVTDDGETDCWGLDASGHIATVPAAMPGGLAFAQLATGGGSDESTCGLTVGGAAYCWGTSVYGAGTTASATPAALPGGYPFAQISVLGSNGCGVTPLGVAYCWGDNSIGELGTGIVPQPGSSIPVKVAGQP